MPFCLFRLVMSSKKAPVVAVQNEAAQDIARARYRSRLLSSSSSLVVVVVVVVVQTSTPPRSRKVVGFSQSALWDVCGGMCVCVCTFFLFFRSLLVFNVFVFLFFSWCHFLKKKRERTCVSFLSAREIRFSDDDDEDDDDILVDALVGAVVEEARFATSPRASIDDDDDDDDDDDADVFQHQQRREEERKQTRRKRRRRFITNLVVKLFPGALDDPEPAGLKRMTKEEWPDQWPANCEEFLELIEDIDDTRELRLVRRVLKQTQMETKKIGHCVRREHARMEWVEFSYAIGWTRVWITHRRNHRRRRFWRVQSKGWLRYGEWVDAISAFLFVYARKKEESDKMCKNWRKWDGNNRRGR